MSEVDKIAPTAHEAIATASKQYTDRDTIFLVQKTLLEKGYVDGGPPDGGLNQKTKDEILTFRARNNLQLIPVIDDELLSCLKSAPEKALPVEQVTATKEQIAPKVEIVAIGSQVQNTAWWSKLWAVVTGIPSILLSLLVAIVENLDEATTAIQPLKSLFYDFGNIPGWVWLVGVVALATVFGFQAMRISNLSKQLEAAAVEGYQRGTIKNDLPPKEQA